MVWSDIRSTSSPKESGGTSTVSGILKAEVYLLEFKLSQHSDPQTLITREFSGAVTIGEFWHLRLQSTAMYTHRIQYLEKV